MADAVVVSNVTKRYGDTTALDALSVSFPSGCLTGFLGPNGAGKTTTFRSMLGLTRPQEGTIDVLGLRVGPDTTRIVRRVGAVVEEPGLHKTLSARDNLRVAALLRGAGEDQIDGLLGFVALSDVADRKVEGFSKGMRQRLALAVAMLGDPEILVLDEPLDGLDPAGQVSLKAQLRSLVDTAGKTVIVSSHDLADVEELADHVIVIDRGRLVASGPLDAVIGSDSGFRVEIADPDRAVEVLTAAGMAVEVRGRALVVDAADGADISRVLAWAALYPSALIPIRPSLERVFLDLTGGEA